MGGKRGITKYYEVFRWEEREVQATVQIEWMGLLLWSWWSLKMEGHALR